MSKFNEGNRLIDYLEPAQGDILLIAESKANKIEHDCTIVIEKRVAQPPVILDYGLRLKRAEHCHGLLFTCIHIRQRLRCGPSTSQARC